MKSLSEYKRPWSVMPMRVFKDRTLKERELRVLGALLASNEWGCGSLSIHLVRGVWDERGKAKSGEAGDANAASRHKAFARELRAALAHEGCGGVRITRGDPRATGVLPIGSVPQVSLLV